VKLGPALDAMIRHKLKVLAVANGQRVPEDWHRLSAQRWCSARCAAPATAWRWTPATSTWSSPACRSHAAATGCRPRLSLHPNTAHECSTSISGTGPAPLDQADGLRRLFAGRQPRFMPLVANPHVAFGSVVLERLTTVLAAHGPEHPGGRRGDTSPAPNEGRAGPRGLRRAAVARRCPTWPRAACRCATWTRAARPAPCSTAVQAVPQAP
jgi:hypothetical protein